MASPPPGILVLKLFIHSSLPRPCFAQSVCLHWPVFVFMSVYLPPPAFLLASTTTGQVPGVTSLCQAGVSSEKLRGCRASYSGCGNYLSLGFSLVEQAAWGAFPLPGMSDRACWSNEKQKPPPNTSPFTEKKRASKGGGRDKEPGFGRAAKGRLASGRPVHTHLTPAHIDTGRAVNYGVENSLQPLRPSIGRSSH